MHINIMSCEGRSYLETTLASLPPNAEATIFYQYETTPLTHPHFKVVNNPKHAVPVRCNAGWHYATILEQGTVWQDRILVVEDDVQFATAFPTHYAELLQSVPPHAMLALYACYQWGPGALEAVPYPVKDFYGTQAMVFDRWTAEKSAQHLYRNLLRWEQYDLLLKEVCWTHHIPLLASRYSLVQHIGAVTTGMSASTISARTSSMTADFSANWDTVQGWFNWMPLYDRMVEQVQAPATFVEIGIWQGRSTIYLANKIKQSGKPITFYAIDTFEGSPENTEAMAYFAAQGTTLEATFRDNLERCGCTDYVNVIVGKSLEVVERVPPQSLDFVFIDGAHDYESVKADIAAWRTKVKPGGWMGGDDYNPPLWPGVVQAVDEAFPTRRVPLWWEADL